MTESKLMKPALRVLAALALIATAACSDEVDPPFEVVGTGSLEGIIFLDADRNGLFDPSAGDRVLPNVRVRLQQRGTTQVIAGADATTSAAGRFTLTGLPVGSHELAIDTAGIGGGVAFCQNPIPVTIFVNEQQFQSVGARGGCVIIIRDAEALPVGSPVTVRGTVSSSPGQIVTNRMYIQDASGGIRLFNVNTGGATLAVGDIVEIAGTLGLNAGETEVTGGRLIERVAGSVPPVTVATTTKAIADAGADAKHPLQGQLVTVRKARVTTIWNNGTGSSRNAFINDGSGPTTVRIDTGVLFVPGSLTDLLNRLSEIMALNKCYDVTGIASAFNATGQLFPRTLADIREVPCS